MRHIKCDLKQFMTAISLKYTVYTNICYVCKQVLNMNYEWKSVKLLTAIWLIDLKKFKATLRLLKF